MESASSSINIPGCNPRPLRGPWQPCSGSFCSQVPYAQFSESCSAQYSYDGPFFAAQLFCSLTFLPSFPCNGRITFSVHQTCLAAFKLFKPGRSLAKLLPPTSAADLTHSNLAAGTPDVFLIRLLCLICYEQPQVNHSSDGQPPAL